MRARAALVVASLVVAGIGTSSPASATVHLMKIREIFGGSATTPNGRFVELQMYSSGQNLTTGSQLKFFNGSGAEIRTLTLTNNVANSQNQRTVLIGTADLTPEFGVTPDFATMASGDILPAGGSVCFQSPAHGVIDCARWGATSGGPAEAGPEAPAIPSGQSLERKITAGCATLLEAGDDTDNSANDFQLVSPNPEPNSATPNESPCGGGGGGGQGDPNVTVANLKTKTPGNKAVISGRILPPDPGGKVKLVLFAKSSPFRKVGKKSDTLDANSAFKKRFTVPSTAVRCRVQVKYAGNTEATKKFKC